MISLPCSSVRAVFGQDSALVLGALGRRLGAAARLLALLLDQLVGREIGKIVERLDARLAQGHQHLLGEVRKLGQRVLDAKAAALLAGRGFAALERFGGAALELAGDFVVEALDRRDFVDRDVGDFLEAGEAFGDQQLRQRLVDVELASGTSRVRSRNSRWRFSLASASVRMSICEVVSWLASRTFWPRRPIARLSWSSGTTTSMRLSSSSMTTRLTVAG